MWRLLEPLIPLRGDKVSCVEFFSSRDSFDPQRSHVSLATNNEDTEIEDSGIVETTEVGKVPIQVSVLWVPFDIKTDAAFHIIDLVAFVEALADPMLFAGSSQLRV